MRSEPAAASARPRHAHATSNESQPPPRQPRASAASPRPRAHGLRTGSTAYAAPVATTGKASNSSRRTAPPETAVPTAQGSTSRTIFVERQVALQEGDAVDIDGDGNVDPDWVVDTLPYQYIANLLYASLDLDEDRVLRTEATLRDLSTGLVYSSIVEVRLPLGTITCPGQPNSTGAAATLHAEGSLLTTANDFSLRATQLPVGTFGYFLNSPNAGFLPAAGGSQGDLCLGAPIGRFVASAGMADPDGILGLAVDVGALPRPMGVTAVQPGETWFFQCWYRDANQSSNFTSGLQVTFR